MRAFLKKVLKNRPAAIIILAITMTDATIMIKTKKMPIISTKTAIATPSSVKQLCVRKTLDRTFLTIEETLGVIVTQEIVITGRKFARAPQTNKVISSKEIMVVESMSLKSFSVEKLSIVEPKKKLQILGILIPYVLVI